MTQPAQRGVKRKRSLSRLSALIPTVDYDQLTALAETNDRSVAAETRIAVENHLKANGRRLK